MRKGISLIVLVITIIVLIILATAGYNYVVGQNGIINRANDARENWNKASYRDAIVTKMGSVKVNAAIEEKDVFDYISDNNPDFSIPGASYELDNESKNIVFSASKFNYIFDRNGNLVGILEKLEDSETVEEQDVGYVLYKRGEEFVPFHGEVGKRASGWEEVFLPIYEEEYMKFYEKPTSLWKMCACRNENALDLTNYSKLHIIYEVIEPTKGVKNGTHYLTAMMIQVSYNSAFDNLDELHYKTNEKGVFEIEQDISSKNAGQYIKLMTYTANGDGYTYTAYDADIRIYKIWLTE